MLTAGELRTLVSYDPETGIFRAKTARSCCKVGDDLGTVNALGYVVIGIKKRLYTCHRLAFLYMTGEWPKEHMDHANGDRADNRWINLREATHTQNLQNSRKRADNTSGFKGVSSRRGSWYAQINLQGRRKYLGAFDDPASAHAAYQAAAIQHFGEFARGE